MKKCYNVICSCLCNVYKYNCGLNGNTINCSDLQSRKKMKKYLQNKLKLLEKLK
jgi:hypothetical protein